MMPLLRLGCEPILNSMVPPCSRSACFRSVSYTHLDVYKRQPVGRLVRDVLIEKAREGVEVRVIYDDVGCWHVPHRFFEEMRDCLLYTSHIILVIHISESINRILLIL